MLKFIQLSIKILSELHLIPPCEVILNTQTKTFTNSLDKTKKELSTARQALQATSLNLQSTNKINKDLEDKYKQMIINDHMRKQDLDEISKQVTKLEANEQKQKQELKKLSAQLTIAAVGLETASLENIKLQSQLDEATDLSKQLKEALDRWTS